MTRKTMPRKSRTARTLREIGRLEDRYQVTATISRAEEQRLREEYPLSPLTRLRVKTETLVSLGKQIAESEAALRVQPNPEAAFKLQRELIELNRIVLQIEDLALDLCQNLSQSAQFTPGEKRAEKVLA